MPTHSSLGALPILGWVFTAVLLLTVVVSFAAGRGAIPLNPYLGIRIAPLMRSDAAWKAGHAAAVVPSAVAFVVSLACCLVGLAVGAVYGGSIVCLVGGLAWASVNAVRAARRSGDHEHRPRARPR